MSKEIITLARIKLIIRGLYERVGRHEVGNIGEESVNVIQLIEEEVDKVDIPDRIIQFEDAYFER